MLNWVIKQLFEPSAWLGLAVIIVALFTRTDTAVILLGMLIIALPDDWIKEQVAKAAPGLEKRIREWTE